MNEYNRNNGRTSLSVEELLEQVEGATMRHVKNKEDSTNEEQPTASEEGLT